MKKFLGTVLCIFALQAVGAAVEEGRFMRYPTIHKDKIAFTYEGDLWLGSVAGGTAVRITTYPGIESFAKLSPDGRWIAFTANYDGPQAVYIIPAEGGEPRRMTYSPGNAQVVGWTPDSRRIVFRSMFENAVGRDPNLYFAGLDGSAPERFPLDRGVLCAFSQDGKKILYCRRGDEEYYWKRYKGGRYQDIWMYDFETKAFTPVSDYVGKNSYPMWIGETMYFVSDRTNGIANIYAQKIGSKEVTQITSYDDFDVMMPSTDGRSIIYVQNGYLHVLDSRTNRSERLRVVVPSDRWARRSRFINPRDYIHAV
ncbi:MAG: hypothetical protein PHX45_10480, partial [Acidobacteriota bacterium]|nr:hypothetical protein [Acidobacteriota bacterium]